MFIVYASLKDTAALPVPSCQVINGTFNKILPLSDNMKTDTYCKQGAISTD
jgi:hypothetical protein